MEEGLARLTAAVEQVASFPTQREGVQEVLDEAAHAMELRKLLLASEWSKLRSELEKAEADGGHLGRMEESAIIWQEVICHELIVATGHRGPPPVPSNQAGLKVALAQAHLRGLLPHESPVFRALDKFIDPPEYEIDLEYEGADVFPDPKTGEVLLTVKVRAADSLRWLKNGVELKECADGGRITGVHSPTLRFEKIMPRDTDQKVWCEAFNKWAPNGIKSKVVYLRIPDEARSAQPPPGAIDDVRVVLAEQDRIKTEHKSKFGSTVAEVDKPSGERRLSRPKPLKKQGSVLGQQYSGRI